MYRSGDWVCGAFFFQAEDGIRDLVRSRGLGDVYKRQDFFSALCSANPEDGRLDDQEIIDHLMFLLFAAHDLSLIHI